MSPRVSLSLQYLHDLESLSFVSYQDPALRRTVSQHGCLPTAHFPRVIYQVDSLGRAFGSDTPKFDMIVVDELCQLEAHVFQETGTAAGGGAAAQFAGLRLAGLSTLRRLMEASDHAIFADNDLSLAHVQAWAETARRGRSKLVSAPQRNPGATKSA